MRPHELLEQELKEWSGGSRHFVACSSGTAALHLALETLCLPPGSRVLVPDYTMIACARAVTLAGLEPVFADCGPRLLIDPEVVEGVLEEDRKVRAVMAVHVYGRRCDMDRIVTAAKANVPAREVFVIEDLAQAHGVPPHPGTDAACWSFYQNKIVAGEEGGAVAFLDKGHADHARRLRNIGFAGVQDYVHLARGHNYRLADTLAELVRRSLSTYSYHVFVRRPAEERLNAECPEEWKQPERDAPWVYDFRVPGMSVSQQKAAVEGLRAAGFPARYGLKPMCFQQEYVTSRYWRKPQPGPYERSPSVAAAQEVIYFNLGPEPPDQFRLREAFDIVRKSLSS